MRCLAEDLPLSALSKIIKVARGRVIPGSNRFACVARRWRDASSCDNEEEPLQLVMHLTSVDSRMMTSKEATRAINWITMHGQDVNCLVLAGSRSPVGCLYWIPSAAAALGNLSRLEVDQEHSLAVLVPVLEQLPHLKHLAVGVAVRDSGGYQISHMPGLEGAAGDVFEHPFILDQRWRPCFWEDLPDMEQLCPKLTHLQVTLSVSSNSCGYFGHVDPRLHRLLPARLQHLTLAGRYDMHNVNASSLTHLTALHVLILSGVDVCQMQPGDLGTVRQVRMVAPDFMFRLYPVSLLARKITDLEVSPDYLDNITSCPHLTRLVLSKWVPEGTAEALAALTGLRELGLQVDTSNRHSKAAMQQTAGMTQLRSLLLEGAAPGDPTTLCSTLAQATQLTSLVLDLGNVQQAADGEVWVAVLQQLTGLRRLAVAGPLVLCQGGSWVAQMVQLTRLELHVRQDALLSAALPVSVEEEVHSPAYGVIEQNLLQQIPEWPASMQQVVVWLPDPWEPLWQRIPLLKPVCCQFTAPQPAGLQFSVWLEQRNATARGWARPFRPCPHLPGVWELQGEVEGGQQ